jgi:molybdopterin synthase catalytic subunit
VVRIQREAISTKDLIELVRSDANGAAALFLGVVRDHNRGRKVLHLEYHAYEEMAEAEMARIEQRALERYPVSAVAVVHRTGRLEIGEVSVGVAVGAAHRGDAFDACRFVIDELKRSVPIWKKEFFDGGEVWVEG